MKQKIQSILDAYHANNQTSKITILDPNGNLYLAFEAYSNGGSFDMGDLKCGKFNFIKASSEIDALMFIYIHTLSCGSPIPKLVDINNPIFETFNETNGTDLYPQGFEDDVTIITIPK